jgi:hypothetical protein
MAVARPCLLRSLTVASSHHLASSISLASWCALPSSSTRTADTRPASAAACSTVQLTCSARPSTCWLPPGDSTSAPRSSPGARNSGVGLDSW